MDFEIKTGEGYRTRLENQTMIEMSKRPSFDQYYIRVGEFTSNTVKNFGNFIENLNLRGSHRIDNHAWHLDHKFSVFQGFNNNIPPYIIGSIYNLEMLPWQENLKKWSRCSISEEELIRDFYNDEKKIR